VFDMPAQKAVSLIYSVLSHVRKRKLNFFCDIKQIGLTSLRKIRSLLKLTTNSQVHFLDFNVNMNLDQISSFDAVIIF
jgi:hypothetical protein